MLFNSFPFIFLFLPVVFAGFYALARVSHKLAAGWLAAASLFFYGWWNPAYVLLLVGSILFNYLMGGGIARAVAAGDRTRAATLLRTAIVADLALLAYYKYANFFVDNVNAVTGGSMDIGQIVLPLGISFFTFTQIAFLVDAWQGKVREYSLVHYGLFVTYFPHLIAGPVLHHGEMMPQFREASTYRFNAEDVAAGLTLFILGLFKKVMIADEMAVYVAPIFDAARTGVPVSALEAWCGALAYTFQLYFDFSGYSDMAIGLSLLFGVRLPLNFDSPYKAVNIVEFWRRWHMTLSRFLRDYLYIPLGGNRRGPARRHVNLFVTMLLGGLWHGAGWTFVLWGGLHGVYLIINHAWQTLRDRMGFKGAPTRLGIMMSCLLTFLAVVVGWVLFRADSVGTATVMLKGMAGLNGFALPDAWLVKWGAAGAWLKGHGVEFSSARDLVPSGLINWLVILLAIVWLAPNTQQIMSRATPALGMAADALYRGWLAWRASPWAAVPVAVLFLVCVFNLHKKSEFLYFQF